jgi:hypothetical protein
MQAWPNWSWKNGGGRDDYDTRSNEVGLWAEIK